MPTDTRRITGPETTQSPYTFVVKPEIPELLKDANGNRQDKRSTDEIRPVFLKAGVISQARGSAYIEQNETKVICAVYGPRELLKREEFSMKGQLTCEFKFATFSCKYRRQHQQDGEERDLSVQLLEALEPAVCLHKFPKAQINVYVTVLQNDGSALAASITCASVALANAGIEMYDLVAGCSARIAGDVLLMDPTEYEEYKSQTESKLSSKIKAAGIGDNRALLNLKTLDENTVNNGSVTVGLMPSLNQISAITSKGELNHELVKKAFSSCVAMCHKLYPVLQNCLIQSSKEKLKDKT